MDTSKFPVVLAWKLTVHISCRLFQVEGIIVGIFILKHFVNILEHTQSRFFPLSRECVCTLTHSLDTIQDLDKIEIQDYVTCGRFFHMHSLFTHTPHTMHVCIHLLSHALSLSLSLSLSLTHTHTHTHRKLSMVTLVLLLT